jgi:hypothetical protein
MEAPCTEHWYAYRPGAVGIVTDWVPEVNTGVDTIWAAAKVALCR